MFQTAAWNLLAARAFQSREAPLVVFVENDTGAAIIPASQLQSGQIGLLGDVLFDYRDLLAQGDESVARRAWEVLARHGSAFSTTALRGEKARLRWSAAGFATPTFAAAPEVVRRDISAESFAAEHTRAARLLRRLVRAGAELRSYPGTESALVRRIYLLKAQQWLGREDNLFADPARVEFIVAAAALGNACDVFTLEQGSTIIAALVTFRDHGVRRFYTTYFDRAWAHHSPGVALLFEVTRQSLAQDLDCDYMTGEQPHKMRLATRAVPLFRAQASAAQLQAVAQSRPAFEIAA
jgi:CelD/BcsL family acetyltransferase involved in cellulose biosynthesis